MTARLQDGGDPLWGPYIYDGSKKGEHVPHSLGDGEFVAEPLIHSASAEDRQEWINKVEAKASLYQFTVAETGETWTGLMPESSPIPNAKVTIGYPATKQLVKEGDEWAIKSAPQANAR